MSTSRSVGDAVSIARKHRLLWLSLLVFLLGFPAGKAQTCLKDNGGCGPPPDLPQQCFPGIIGGPSSWQDPAEEQTWQLRRGLQSPRNTCEPPLGSYFPNCCSNNPPTTPRPIISIFTVGTRVKVAYDAPNLYCGERSIGDWPIGITCNYGAYSDLDQLVLSYSGGPIRYTFIYFENGIWDTGVDIPCGTTQSYQATIQYLANDNTPLSESTPLTSLPATPLPGPCPDRNVCSAPSGTSPSGGSPPVSAGLPINVGSGDVTVTQFLFTIAQEPMPLPFTLTYHSAAPMFPALVSSPVGLGWTHEYAQTLRPEDGTNNRLYHITPEGYEHEYLRIAPDAFWVAISPAELRGTITLVGSEYQLLDLNGTVTSFDVASGRWNSTKDRWGNTIFGSYTGSQLTTITDTMTRQIQLSYTSSLVTITLPNGKTWKMTLAGGLMTAIRDPIHLSSDWRTYTYVSDHAGVQRLLSSVKDDAAKELEAHTYDNVAGTGKDRGLTSSQAGGTRSNVSVTYDDVGNTRTVTHTIVTSPSIQQTTTFTLAYLGGRWLPSQISGNCSTCGGSNSDLQIFSYDSANHVTDRKDSSVPDQVETQYSYDGNGMLLSKIEAVGKSETRTTNYAYSYVPPGGSGLAPWPAFLT